jgi:predicted DNA-binding transcriptional regulator YafY
MGKAGWSMDKKTKRVISIYQSLQNGEAIRKKEAAKKFRVDERTIQRDLDDVRAFLADDPMCQDTVVYDRSKKAYVLQRSQNPAMTSGELFAVCKILLESRSMVKEEMMPILTKLLEGCAPEEESELIRERIANEQRHYLEPHHGKKVIQTTWEISHAVYEQKLLRIHYQKLGSAKPSERLLQPVGILFSEYYFYLAAFSAGERAGSDPEHGRYPKVYRIDRIVDCEILEETFPVPYGSRFEEGEFRKRIQFMYGGQLRQIHFRYTGPSLEAVLDRLPTAQVMEQDETGWTISAEVYGAGVDMWLRSQGAYVEVL